MKITTIGIDLAKSVSQVHGVDERGKTVLRRQFKRPQVAEFMANLPPCLIGMEACGSVGPTKTRTGYCDRISQRERTSRPTRRPSSIRLPGN